MKRNGLIAFTFALTTATATSITANAADMIQPGTAAPGFTLPSQDNTPISLSDYKGKYVVLYFYPKDKTSGCTIEAHNFQRDLDKYKALNAVVLGVSLDTADSHKSFCTKESLTFKLLADPEHKVIDAYGVPVKDVPATEQRPAMKFAERDTYLISPSGKVVKAWTKVDPNTHSETVLATISTEKK